MNAGFHVDAQLSRVTRSRAARALLAAAIIAVQLWVVASGARSWLGLPFNGRPGEPPAFSPPPAPPEMTPANWNRLAVSRWDALHYMNTAMRGFSLCPPGDLRGSDLTVTARYCEFKFYPGYSVLSRLVTAALRIPVDWGMLIVAAGAGFGALFLWTGPAMVSALGVRTTMISLLLFSVFPSAFHLVSLHTESLTVFLGLAALIALRHRAYASGALLAGAVTGIHARATGFGFAFAAALLVSLFDDPPRAPAERARRVLLVPVCVWGGLALMGFYWLRYHDPYLYKHHGMPTSWVAPGDGTLRWSVYASLRPPYAGPVLVALALGLALGVRDTLLAFRPAERAYLAIGTLFVVGVPLMTRYGDFLGMQRYELCGFPMFFALARGMRTRPLLLAVWVGLSALHYWDVELCLYLSEHVLPAVCPCWKY